MATTYERTGPTYSVGQPIRTFDKENRVFINGEVKEVGDESFTVKWEDLEDETEYEIQKVTLEGDILFE
jgi:hypothetical protein